MRVALTREEGANDELRTWLPEDVDVVEVPLTTTRFFDGSEVQATLRGSEHYGAFGVLVVTSARSALYVSLAREALAEGGRVLSVGAATARALESADLDVDVVGEGGARELLPEITDGPVLLLGAAAMRDELADELRSRSIEVTTLTCYETLPAVLSSDGEGSLRDADVVFIGAPSAWLVANAFVSPNSWVIVPGATTGDAVRRSHERVVEGWGAQLREHLRSL